MQGWYFVAERLKTPSLLPQGLDQYLRAEQNLLTVGELLVSAF